MWTKDYIDRGTVGVTKTAKSYTPKSGESYVKSITIQNIDDGGNDLYVYFQKSDGTTNEDYFILGVNQALKVTPWTIADSDGKATMSIAGSAANTDYQILWEVAI